MCLFSSLVEADGAHGTDLDLSLSLSLIQESEIQCFSAGRPAFQQKSKVCACTTNLSFA